MKVKKEKVIVAISGGVDSSTAALLLQKKGYEVMGVFMRLGVDQGNAEDAARMVCQKLRIKFYPFNIAPQFRKEVVKYFTDSYAKGLTPNPCVNCNKHIKFGELIKLADQLGADYLATGHYIKLKVESLKGKVIYKLYKGKDEGKDQSYFLYNLTQKQLARILFPLGDYKKEEVKKLAEKSGLPNIKTESQDVCFLKGDHNDFLKQKIKLKPGNIILCHSEPKAKNPEILRFTQDDKCEPIGQHKGLPLYTIGQRRGVEIGGTGPYYVVRADYEKNILYVSKDRDDPELYKDELISVQTNWVSGEKPKLPLKCEAVIRYRHRAVECVITKERGNALLIQLKKPERAITPGQSVVFYKGDEVIGGGIIEI